MKKFALSLAVVFGVALVSCGGEKKAADSETVAVDSVEVVDTTVVDSAAADTVAPAVDSVK